MITWVLARLQRFALLCRDVDSLRAPASITAGRPVRDDVSRSDRSSAVCFTAQGLPKSVAAPVDVTDMQLRGKPDAELVNPAFWKAIE